MASEMAESAFPYPPREHFSIAEQHYVDRQREAFDLGWAAALNPESLTEPRVVESDG